MNGTLFAKTPLHNPSGCIEYRQEVPMDAIDLALRQDILYARKPQRNEKAVATVAASVAEFDWRRRQRSSRQTCFASRLLRASRRT